MKKSYFKLFSIALAIFAFASCSQNPEESLSTEDSDVVVTLYSDTTDFTRYATFSIVDSVLTIDDDGNRVRVLGSAEETMINTIVKEMEKKGYTKVDTIASPDLFIDLATLTMTTTGTVWYPGYWGGGYYGGCWYYPCWGGSYPGYGGGGYTYEYETGSVVIDVFSQKGELNDKELVFVPWNVYLQGILSSSTLTNHSRIQTNIERAFSQSPYLNIN
jgi:hypothetical protein